jgi:hypothetical protein
MRDSKTIAVFLMLFGLCQTTAVPPPSEPVHYPKLIRADVPLYPSLARTAHITGDIQILVTVENGSVTDTQVRSAEVKVTDPSNQAVYDVRAREVASRQLSEPSLENLKTWRFEPEPTIRFAVTYVYRIEGETTSLPENPDVQLDLPRLIKVTARPFRPTCSDCGARH